MTDSNTVLHWSTMKDTGGTVRRWLDLIQEFDFTVTHWSGKNNINADLISHAKHMSEPSPSDIESITQGKEDIYPLPWKHVNNSSKHIPKPSRKSTPLSSCPPQEEDSFYPTKMENPPHFLLFWSQPKTEFRRNSF